MLQGRFLKFFGFYFTVNVLDRLFNFHSVISVSTARLAALTCRRFLNERACTRAREQFGCSLYRTHIISLAMQGRRNCSGHFLHPCIMNCITNRLIYFNRTIISNRTVSHTLAQIMYSNRTYITD